MLLTTTTKVSSRYLTETCQSARGQVRTWEDHAGERLRTHLDIIMTASWQQACTMILQCLRTMQLDKLATAYFQQFEAITKQRGQETQEAAAADRGTAPGGADRGTGAAVERSNGRTGLRPMKLKSSRDRSMHMAGLSVSVAALDKKIHPFAPDASIYLRLRP